MLWNIGLSAALTLAFVVGCSNVSSVSYDYDDSYEISTLRTYDWLPLTRNNKQRIDTITFERIKRAIADELVAKGLSPSSTSPSFVVQVVFGSKSQTRGARHGRGYRYKEGYLSIDFIDPVDDSLIWYGTARAALEADYTPEESERIINDVVATIMKKFPPPGAK